MCNLHCLDHRSCDNALVYGINGDEASIFCENSYSCNSMEVHAYNSESISLFCFQSNLCHFLTVFGTNSNNIGILCDYSSESYKHLDSNNKNVATPSSTIYPTISPRLLNSFTSN